MTTDRGPPKDKPPPERQAAEREAKLAEALRANLRRRKVDAKSKAPKAAPGDST
jgi:hypothetical protein